MQCLNSGYFLVSLRSVKYSFGYCRVFTLAVINDGHETTGGFFQFLIEIYYHYD